MGWCIQRKLILSLSIFVVFAQSPTEPTIRVPVRLVIVPTLVFSKDRQLIPGLQTTDFKAFDNGRLQEITLDTGSRSVSIALAVQASQDVRAYVPFIAKAGTVVENHLLGESGEAALIAYGDDVTIVKPFDIGDVQTSLRKLSASGRRARMIDAGIQAIALLKERHTSRARILVLIGQPMDSGSESNLGVLKDQADRKNVSIYTLTPPEFGKAFVSDTFSIQGVSRAQRGGFQADVDFGRLISTLGRIRKAEDATDPFSVLTTATGGTQIRFRKQNEFENAIAMIGVELQSTYLLSYSPSSASHGYHAIEIEVSVPGPVQRRTLVRAIG